MPQPNSSSRSTPKGARTQTSIFSFFSTPKKAGRTAAPQSRDSQDELLEEASAAIGDDLLAEVEQAEVMLSSPAVPKRTGAKTLGGSAKPKGIKRKALAASHFEELDAAGSDTSEEDGADDDADDDYNPAASVQRA
ncbi:hypothetical protein GGI02_003788, partial [Coemansia sp. RSA 2322]